MWDPIFPLLLEMIAVFTIFCILIDIFFAIDAGFHTYFHVTANEELTSGGLIVLALREAQSDVNCIFIQKAPVLAV